MDWDNSIDYDDASDGSDGGYNRHGSPINPEAMKELIQLRIEVARLREALGPFAKNYWSDDWHDGSGCEIHVQLRDIRRAAVLVDGYVWKPDE